LVHDAFVSASASSQQTSGSPLLAWLLTQLKNAVKYAALTLLARTDGGSL
jgi:DNA-directed RNA polymerase specialized sigma24 family protein